VYELPPRRHAKGDCQIINSLEFIMQNNIARLLALSVAVLSLSFSAAPAIAKNSNSLGHGVKCSWVLVSSANGSNVYQNICRRGV
jgi:H+/gluconate symporter-like permease